MENKYQKPNQVKIEDTTADNFLRKVKGQEEVDVDIDTSDSEIKPVERHPLDSAKPHLDSIKISMKKIITISQNYIKAVDHITQTGETQHLLDPQAEFDREFWEKKDKEADKLVNNLYSFLKVKGQ